MISTQQLTDAGYNRDAIRHRVERGRLFLVHRGVYALGSPDLTQHGRWIAAVLACGEGAALSHASAAELYRIRSEPTRPVHVSTPFAAHSRDGIVVHHRTELNVTTRDGIPVTTPIDTLFDIAIGATEQTIEADINEAAKLGLITPKQLHRAAKKAGRRPGAAAVRRILDKQTFVLTDSELERLFLRIVRRAGLPAPRTQAHLNGFRVDFYWPELDLVVETDGASYHATPAQQTRDRIRDQALSAAGLVVIRFTHAQIAYEPKHVAQTLEAVMQRPVAPAPPARTGRGPRRAPAGRRRPPHRSGGP